MKRRIEAPTDRWLYLNPTVSKHLLTCGSATLRPLVLPSKSHPLPPASSIAFAPQMSTLMFPDDVSHESQPLPILLKKRLEKESTRRGVLLIQSTLHPCVSRLTAPRWIHPVRRTVDRILAFEMRKSGSSIVLERHIQSRPPSRVTPEAVAVLLMIDHAERASPFNSDTAQFGSTSRRPPRFRRQTPWAQIPPLCIR